MKRSYDQMGFLERHWLKLTAAGLLALAFFLPTPLSNGDTVNNYQVPPVPKPVPSAFDNTLNLGSETPEPVSPALTPEIPKYPKAPTPMPTLTSTPAP